MLENANNPFNSEYDPSTIIIATPGYFLGKESERLIIKKNRETIAEIPLLDISQILITSKGNTLSTTLINEMTKRGIKICIWAANMPNIVVSSPQLAAFVEAKRAQFKAYENNIGVELMKAVIKSKINNQINFLRYASKNNKRSIQYHTVMDKIVSLSRYSAEIDTLSGINIDGVRQSILSLEAHASKAYWNCFGMLLKKYTFTGRNARGKVDVINAALNYSYAILYSIIWMSIMNAGLEPFAGFLHTDRPGKPSLVYDLSEPFKSRIVDKVILSIANKSKLEYADKRLTEFTRKNIATRILDELNTRENYQGRKLLMRSIIQSNIYSVVSKLKGVGNYEPYSMKW
jgi:CRISPR-associated protein Cas1